MGLIDPILNNITNMAELIHAVDLILGGWFVISMMYAFIIVLGMAYWEVTRDPVGGFFNSFAGFTVVGIFLMLVKLDDGSILLSFERWLIILIPTCGLLVYKLATDR